ncbi:MAG: hypothetical protein V3T56_07190 [Gemmatimonadales bacterium]
MLGLRRIRRNLLLSIGLNAVAATGCDFDTLTEAQDQLRRGPLREYEFVLPIVQDTFVLSDVFDSLKVGIDSGGIKTLPDGLLAIVLDTVSFALFIPVSIPSLVVDTVVTIAPIWETVDSAMLNLGDFTDALASATLNTAFAALNFSNTADAPIELVNFQLGVVPVVGGSLDSVAGQPAFVTDGGGTPILIDVVDPGSTVFALGRMQTNKVDSLQAASLVDVLIDRVLAGDAVALVGVGDIHVGDGTVVTVNAGDVLALSVVPIIGLDLTLAPGGVAITLPTFLESGLDLDAEIADDLTDNVLDSVGLELVVDNGVAFGLQVETAFVGDSVTGDVFTAPGAVLDTMLVSAAAVDANGRATASTRDTTGLILDNADVTETFGSLITIGVRIRLLPPVGGRGRIHDSDNIKIAVTARVWLHVGGAP